MGARTHAVLVIGLYELLGNPIEYDMSSREDGAKSDDNHRYTHHSLLIRTYHVNKLTIRTYTTLPLNICHPDGQYAPSGSKRDNSIGLIEMKSDWVKYRRLLLIYWIDKWPVNVRILHGYSV